MRVACESERQFESDQTNLEFKTSALLFEELKTLDWDFPKADTGYLTHGLHPYPAKFIPHIPNALIRSLSKPGDTVADIFCGSGTTLVEALVLGRNAVGTDASELACLITKAKTARLVLNELAALEDLASGLESLPLDESQPSLFQPGDRSADYDIPQDASIDFWFDPHVSRELGTIRSRCKDLPEDARIVAQACFSSIIVAVSKQDSDTRYVRRQKDIRVGETMRRFVRAIRNAAASLAKFSTLVSPSLNCRVIHGDVLAGPDIGAVDLVVTSPPYPNAYSYHLYHMTRMLWLDMDQVGFKAREIGSHRKYSRSGPSRATAATFKNELAAVFAWLYRHVKPRGHCCFVVGDSIIHGETVQNDELVIETATTHGFELIDSLGRRLQDTKKSFNPKIGKIKEENIIILRRD